MVSIVKTPHVTYEESDSNPTWTGEGAYVPVFIGLTGNVLKDEEGNEIKENNKNKPLPLSIKKIKNYASARREVALGGIGTDTETNPLLAALKDFFEEAAKQTSNDISIPYVYVIDMSINSVSDLAIWNEAMELAKTKRDARVEVFVGFKSTDDELDITSILTSANRSIVNDSKNGIPRTALTTISGANDEKLMKITDEENTVTITVGEGAEATTKEVPAYIQESRIGITEPNQFGKIVAKICTTPYYEEPGYTDFRTIKGGEFDKRTPAQEEDLMNAGIIFIRDELADATIHPKICLAVSTAFAKVPESRPNDSLLHARRNTDHLITRVYDTCYSQLKRNETKVNISHLQTDVDCIVDDEVSKGYMMDGSKCLVAESEADPYHIQVDGNAIPVNSSLYVHFGMYVSNPNIMVEQ